LNGNWLDFIELICTLDNWSFSVISELCSLNSVQRMAFCFSSGCYWEKSGTTGTC